MHGQGPKSEQKHTTKNVVGFHNHSTLLTMSTCTTYDTVRSLTVLTILILTLLSLSLDFYLDFFNLVLIVQDDNFKKFL